MAFNDYSGTDFGQATDYLTSLRKALDLGQVTAAEYLQKGMPVAQQAYRDLNAYGGKGSNQGKDAQRIMGYIDQAGFQLRPNSSDTFNVVPNLPSQYQEQIRQSLLPAGLSEDQKAAYLNQIPQDIKFGSDQYNIEKEGLRQKLQSEGVAATQKVQRAQQLNDLAGILSNQADTNFQRSIPTVAENANTAGIYRSTGYGEALAKQQGQLQQDVQSQLAQQGLQDRAIDTGSLGDILAAQQGFQSAGVQRQFSLDDFATQARYAQQLADAAKPQNPGKTNGQKWAQGINAGVGVGGLIAAPFTGGASLAATAGAGAASKPRSTGTSSGGSGTYTA